MRTRDILNVKRPSFIFGDNSSTRPSRVTTLRQTTTIRARVIKSRQRLIYVLAVTVRPFVRSFIPYIRGPFHFRRSRRTCFRLLRLSLYLFANK